MKKHILMLALLCGFALPASANTNALEQALLDDAMGRAWLMEQGQALRGDAAFQKLPPEQKAERRLQLSEQWNAMSAEQKKAAFNALSPDAKGKITERLKKRWQPTAEQKAKAKERAKKRAATMEKRQERRANRADAEKVNKKPTAGEASKTEAPQKGWSLFGN
jgi:hypothetical protein